VIAKDHLNKKHGITDHAPSTAKSRRLSMTTSKPELRSAGSPSTSCRRMITTDDLGENVEPQVEQQIEQETIAEGSKVSLTSPI
jgi:hypothetical protein